MRAKRTLIRLDKNNKDQELDIFVKALVKRVTRENDLEEQDVMESIARLEKLGVIIKEEVSIH